MEIDNALVRQKDYILQLVNEGRYKEAITLLNFSEDLWASCGYHYKYKEIMRCITGVDCTESP